MKKKIVIDRIISIVNELPVEREFRANEIVFTYVSCYGARCAPTPVKVASVIRTIPGIVKKNTRYWIKITHN